MFLRITNIQTALRLGVCLLWAASLPLSVSAKAVSIRYATPIDSASWDYTGSKFGCEIIHNIHGFGAAVFEQRAGLKTRFLLQSQTTRLKAGKANLVSQPPLWLSHKAVEPLSSVNVGYGSTPIKIGRKLSERMLAELEKGMDLHVIRQPWYGDTRSLQVVIPSISFRQTYREYLSCLATLLPVNFDQIEKRSLRYNEGDEDLTKKAMSYLDKVALYMKEDPEVKVVYIDGHTDSQGVRAENLLKSEQRAKKVVNYLRKRGIDDAQIIARWHGERYQIATNQTLKGRAKNRRVTVRLSKEMPTQ